MGITLSANTNQFIGDLISPNGTTFSAGTTELLTPNGDFTMEDLRTSLDLKSKITSGDVRLFSNTNEIVSIDNIGINVIESFGGKINQNLVLSGSLSADTLYGDGSNLSGVSNSDIYVTGGTYNDNTDNLELLRGDDTQLTISLSALTSQSANYFNAYDGSGGTLGTVTNTWVDVPMDVQRKNDVDYSHNTTVNNEEVTIQTDGVYLLIGTISCEGSASNSRSQVQTRLMHDDGSGYAQVDGTQGQIYVRQNLFGGSATFVAPLTLSINDKVKMQFRRTNGTSTINLQSGGSSLTIINIKGPKGERGETGSATGITNDIQSVYVTGTTSTVSTSPVDLNGITLTTKNLGGPATYNINFTASRSNSVSNNINYFYITVDGVRVSKTRVRSFSNEIHSVSLSADVENVTNNTIIKIEYDASGGGVHTVYERTLSINGILDSNVV